MKRQRGIAALTAILVVAIATVLAVNLLWHTSVDLRRTESLLNQDQARQYDLGGEDAAKLLLAADAREGETDTLLDAWVKPQQRQFLNGTLDLRLTDEQGRFDLNSLVDAGTGKRNPKTAEQFERLLQLLPESEDFQPPDPGTAAALTDATVDWIDPGSDTELNGAEDDVYTNRQPPYRTANFWLTSPSELLAVAGYTQAIYTALSPYVTALPRATNGAAWPLNVNTASAPVLAALLSGQTIDSVQPVLSGSFENANEFWTELGVAPSQDNPPIDVRSSWFLLTVSTSVGSSRSTMYSLLERDDQLVLTRLRTFDAR